MPDSCEGCQAIHDHADRTKRDLAQAGLAHDQELLGSISYTRSVHEIASREAPKKPHTCALM